MFLRKIKAILQHRFAILKRAKFLRVEAFRLRTEFGHRVTFASRRIGCFHPVTKFTFTIIIVSRSAGDPAHRSTDAGERIEM